MHHPLPAIEDRELLDGLDIGYIKFFGLWKFINYYRTTGKRDVFVGVTFISSIVSLPYFIFQIQSFFYVKFDFQKITVLLLPVSLGFLAHMKMLLCWFGADVLSRLYDLSRKDFLETVPEHKLDEAKEISRGISKKSKVIGYFCFLLGTIVLVTEVSFPRIPVDYISGKMVSSEVGSATGIRKILGGWYPVPMDESPYYEIIYAYEAFISAYALMYLTVLTCMFCQILICLYEQFSVFVHHVSTIKIDNKDALKSNDIDFVINDIAALNDLYGIIKDHHKLLRYTEDVRNFFNPVVTIILGFAVFVLIISISQFLFGMSESGPTLLRSLQYAIFETLEVCMFCFASSLIETASSDLQFAIYCSDWYKADTKFRKTAQMLMIRAKKGMTLTAIRMYPVNIETIMSILQFTYSTSTLMLRMSR